MDVRALLQARVLAKTRAMQQRRKASGPLVGVPSRLLDWRGVADFCSQQLRIKPLEESDTLKPFDLNWMQRRILSAEIRARRAGKRPWFLILKYRKGGVTTLEQALAYWDIWRREHVECLTVGPADKSARLIFRMVERFYNFQPPQYRHRKTQAYVGHMEYPDRDALYMVSTAGQELRGSTLSRAHMSEVAHYSNLASLHTALQEGIGPTSAYIWESTPNGQEGDGAAFYEMWQAAKKGRVHFVPLFFPWHSDPGNVRLAYDRDELLQSLREDKAVADLMKRHGLSEGQVAWYLDKKRGYIDTDQGASTILQEHPSDDESCFLTAADSYYDYEILTKTTDGCIDPVVIEDNGRLRIWEVPDKDDPATYIIGADPSGGVGGDEAGVVGFNLKTGRQAFSYQYNRMPPDDLGSELLPYLGKRWANPSSQMPAFIVVEQNNHGHVTLSALLKQSAYPKDRVYHNTDDSKVDAVGDSVATARSGWVHTITGHADLTAAVGRMMRHATPRILDKNTAASIRKVARGPNGTASFSGRDLAVAAGLCVIGWAYAAESSSFAFIGGRAVRLGDKSNASPPCSW